MEGAAYAIMSQRLYGGQAAPLSRDSQLSRCAQEDHSKNEVRERAERNPRRNVPRKGVRHRECKKSDLSESTDDKKLGGNDRLTREPRVYAAE